MEKVSEICNAHVLINARILYSHLSGTFGMILFHKNPETAIY